MPTPPPAPPGAPRGAPRPTAAPELRRQLMFLILGVVVLDVLALVLYRVLGVAGWPDRRQLAFTAAWVALTVVVVMGPLQRMRAARVRARRTRAGTR